MADLGRLALTYMEKKSILSNAMVDDFLDEVDFKVLRSAIIWCSIFCILKYIHNMTNKRNRKKN
jgi:hypothetical protein